MNLGHPTKVKRGAVSCSTNAKMGEFIRYIRLLRRFITNRVNVLIILQLKTILLRKADEQWLHYMAYYETLTGLPNRLHMTQIIDQALHR